jgi:hypothetical protein
MLNNSASLSMREATHETTHHQPQGVLFARLKLQPLPLYKSGPEDEQAWPALTPATPVLH